MHKDLNMHSIFYNLENDILVKQINDNNIKYFQKEEEKEIEKLVE